MTAHRPSSLLVALLAFAGILFALVAAKCEQTTEFPPFLDEICTDNADNDGDNLVDCADSDCDGACAVQVVIFPLSPTLADSIMVSGSHENVASIALTVTPSGITEPGTIVGNEWSAMIRQLGVAGTYTVRVTATSAKDRKDTAVMTFEKRN